MARLHAQRGVVMFVALIVLVAMALAALALIRAVDTTTAVVGNLGFRQASLLPANAAVEEAVAALFETNTIADKTKPLAAQNYYATKQAGEDARGIPQQLQKKANFTLTRVLNPDTSNQVRYVIERMCNEQKAPDITHCDMTLPAEGAGTTTGEAGLRPLATIPFYRVTIRVDGPRNTASFVQVMLR